MNTFDTLTKRQKEILNLICQGFSNDEITDKLCIAKTTICTYIEALYEAYDITGSSGAHRVKLVLKRQEELKGSLKDKNGRVIHEGDIVDVYVSSKKLLRYQVKYEIGSLMLVSDKEMFDFPNKWNDNVYPLSQLYFEYENEENCIYQLEIIGNIYENPELLEVKC